jgi:MFS family permease
MGLVFSAFAYPYLLFQVFGGWIADKVGPRKSLLLCGLIWSGATFATGLVHGMVSLFVVRLILGFGEGATFPTATRAMSYWTPMGKRGFAQGITPAWGTPWRHGS